MANFLYQFQAPYGKVGIILISNENLNENVNIWIKLQTHVNDAINSSKVRKARYRITYAI